ncbi:hypothetical protein HJC23_001523 [Cyclotella cryptica]|uniref:Protein YIPF n=1 Tax=Cyclotella cryptica TaxID=29204 RepID=A0ABD3Q2A0_9STRA|eukprot:CCRYP_010742-RA/>CCRYP_010742-RA protein AED:0.12 eAED:0.12 QI:0/-1/0/1/-1/1/1/0/390
MDSPPSNPFSKNGNDQSFDAFSLNPQNDSSSGGGTSMLPSLQSIQMHQQILANQQQQAKSDSTSLPAPDELKGPIGATTQSASADWPPPPPTKASCYNLPSNVNNDFPNSATNRSFLQKLITCGGVCSIDALRPYFDIDTADIWVRIKSSIKYCMVNDGFRNEVLYSDNALKLDASGQQKSSPASSNSQQETTDGGESVAVSPTVDTSSVGKGPDLYGPVWITMTLVFFVAVTSNMSIYVHHSFKSASKLEEGGVAAEKEWDYDINQLLRATWILYSFSILLPAAFYVVFRVGGVTALGLVDLICFYGYSLVAYLPVTWVCIVPIHWVQWTSLGIATILSGMLVVRNVMGPILESAAGPSQGKSGSLIMSVMGCHFVFFLVMKLAFYHQS